MSSVAAQFLTVGVSSSLSPPRSLLLLSYLRHHQLAQTHIQDSYPNDVPRTAIRDETTKQRVTQRPIGERPDLVPMLCFAMTSRVSDNFLKPLLRVRAYFQ